MRRVPRPALLLILTLAVVRVPACEYGQESSDPNAAGASTVNISAPLTVQSPVSALA